MFQLRQNSSHTVSVVADKDVINSMGLQQTAGERVSIKRESWQRLTDQAAAVRDFLLTLFRMKQVKPSVFSTTIEYKKRAGPWLRVI